MRRRQTALLLVFLLVSGLSFASQTRPSAEVGSVNPDDTTGMVLQLPIKTRTVFLICMKNYFHLFVIFRTWVVYVKFKV